MKYLIIFVFNTQNEQEQPKIKLGLKLNKILQI